MGVSDDTSVYSYEDRKEEAKEGFYEQLQATLREVHRQDKVIVIGDVNARVGRNMEVLGGVIGRQGEVAVAILC